MALKTAAYPMDETRLVFIDKSRTVYDFSLETDRHATHSSFGDKGLIKRFFIKQTECSPGRSDFTTMPAQLQRKLQARLASYQ